MILDSSAILAILFAEPGHERLLERINAASAVAVGGPTVLEAAIVLGARTRKDPRPVLHEFLRDAEAEIVPFGPDHYHAAVDAFLRFGKGRHPAGLNFGDCMSYAVASLAGLPLLFAGDDFAATDIDVA